MVSIIKTRSKLIREQFILQGSKSLQHPGEYKKFFDLIKQNGPLFNFELKQWIPTRLHTVYYRKLKVEGLGICRTRLSSIRRAKIAFHCKENPVIYYLETQRNAAFDKIRKFDISKTLIPRIHTAIIGKEDTKMKVVRFICDKCKSELTKNFARLSVRFCTQEEDGSLITTRKAYMDLCEECISKLDI